MRVTRVALAALLLAGAGERADAQLLPGFPLTVEARLGGSVPTGGFASRDQGIEAEPGVALAIGGMVRVLPGGGVYAQYRWERLGCGECADVGIDESATSAGVEAGAQVDVPLELVGVRSPLRPWVRGGVVLQALELAGAQGGVASEHGAGFAVGTGIEVPVGNLLLLPGIHYRNYPAHFEFDGLPPRQVDVTQLVVDVGVALSF